MVEYKVTGKNKIECANDYVENHIGEEIHFLNNDAHYQDVETVLLSYFLFVCFRGCPISSVMPILFKQLH